MFNLFKKKSESEVSVFPIDTDIHSHILPGIDDGSPDIETSLQLISALNKLGIKKTIATPHIIGDMYRNTPQTINEALDKTREAVAKANIDIEIGAAAEYMLDDHFMRLLKADDRLLTIHNNLLLVEIPYTSPPYDLEEMAFQIITEGYQPILAHPERYFYYKDLKEFERLKELGFLLQVNLLSLTGYYGKNAEKMATRLIEKGMVSFVGTDLHHGRHLKGLEDNLGVFDKLLRDGKYNILK